MKNLSLISVFFIILFHSCKKEDYIEINKTNGVTTKATYKKGELVSSAIYNKSGQLDNKCLYKKGVIIKIYQYYPDEKMQSYSYLNKAPNHYTTTVYYKNGKISNEGEGDYYKDKNLYLKRGEWIFYSKSGKPFSIYGFMHDGEKQYIKSEMLFDTIKKKTKKDTIFNPPFLVKNGGFVPLN